MFTLTRLELAAIIYLACSFGALVGIVATALMNAGKDDNHDKT